MRTYGFRFDYYKLANEESPEATKVADGSTLYVVDTGAFYLAYKGEWYLQDFSEESAGE